MKKVNTETIQQVWEALGDDTVTTSEATDRLADLFDKRCPDDLARMFTKLRKKGLLKGEVSSDRGGWIWWADEECRSKMGKGGELIG